MKLPVYLNNDYFRTVEAFADKLMVEYAAGRKIDHFYRTDGAPTSREAVIRGLCPEAGFAQWAGLDYDPVILRGGDGGIDFVLEGITVQVKSTFYRTGHLVFDTRESFRAMVAVLMWVDRDTPRRQSVVGWLTRGNFFEECEYRTLNADRGPKFVLAPEILLPPSVIPRVGNRPVAPTAVR